MWKRHHVKYPLFLSHFNETWASWTDFRKNLKHQISSKSVQWEPSCSVRTAGRTDITNVKVAFRNFANAPETVVSIQSNSKTQGELKHWLSTCRQRSYPLISSETRTTLHSGHFAWWRAAHRTPLFHSVVSRGPHVLLQYTALNVRFLVTTSKERAGKFPFGSQTRVTLTNALFTSKLL